MKRHSQCGGKIGLIRRGALDESGQLAFKNNLVFFFSRVREGS